MLIFLSRLGADVVIWTVAVTVAGVCTVGLWQLRSGQLAWEACADFVSWVVDSSSFALQQVSSQIPESPACSGGISQTVTVEVAWAQKNLMLVVAQVLQMMPGWTRLTHLKTTKCAHLERLSGQKTIKMLPLACLGDSGSAFERSALILLSMLTISICWHLLLHHEIIKSTVLPCCISG